MPSSGPDDVGGDGRVEDEDSSGGDTDSGSLSTETSFAFRTGIGYMFEVSNVPLVPILCFDIVDSDDGVDAHLVFGLTIDIPKTSRR